MDFADAIRAHVDWKLRLRMLIDGQGEPLTREVAARDDACDLGRWIYGEGRFYLDDPAYQELKTAHARFQAAARILTMAETGNRRGAAAGLEGGEYSRWSSAVVAAIMRMRDVAA